ncbi:kremen protein 2 [Protopterus annectens]|uniref:kremen protein 2 n=1 Tax=Protopterus annectens TaxID=7888 RepID=UPI001CFAD5B9|nr:kremen protein 2 [Protopterus annectens]
MCWFQTMALLLQAFLQISLALQKQELSECFKVNGADYRGTQNQTSVVNGKPCLFWNQTHQHAYNTAKYPNGEWGLGNHNYCRNPDGDVQPWCYVSEIEDGIYWKYCDIPTCHMPGYLGCFLDSGNPPALSGNSGTSTKLTVQVCLRFCRKKGYKYAGVEAGYACFCGQDIDMSKNEQVGTVECDQVCFGKSSELCGGDGRIGIYDVSVGACEGNMTDSSGVIYSPDFPDEYGPDSNCSWNIYLPSFSTIEVDFKLFEIRDRNDRLELRDGRTHQLLAHFNGHQKPEIFMVFPTNYLILTFQSDQILHAQGFALFYQGLKDNSSEEEDGIYPSNSVSQPPTTTDEHINGSVSSLAAVSPTSTGAWVMYTATAITIILLIIALYYLRRRTCLFAQKKSAAEGLIIKNQKDRCHCTSRDAWSVAYRHTKVVICSNGKGDDSCSDCSCLCESYNNLSVTNQSSLKSLISTS